MMNQQPSGHVNSSQVAPKLNHGGHDLFDSHEIIAGMINVLDQYMIFRTFMSDQELISLLDRQYTFIESQYNVLAQAFSTGQPPSQSTGVYKMTLSHDVQFGLTPSQPKKPNRNISEVKEAGLSAHMLGLIKGQASLMGMAASEITNPIVRRIVADTVPNFIELAYEIFLYQNKHQYYQVPQLNDRDAQAMTSAYQPVIGQKATMPQPKTPIQ